MKIKTSELTGAALDWAVAKCCAEVNVRWSAAHEQLLIEGLPYSVWQPHKNWAQGGVIIEKGQVSLVFDFTNGSWCARIYTKPIVISYDGPTPLIAAMRCYVASKLGDDVEIPEELTNVRN